MELQVPICIILGGRLPEYAEIDGRVSEAACPDVFIRAVVDGSFLPKEPFGRRTIFDFTPESFERLSTHSDMHSRVWPCKSDKDHKPTGPLHILLGKDDEITFGLGFVLEIPKGYAGFIIPRSSTIASGLEIVNQSVPIDSDFRGEPIVVVRAKRGAMRLTQGQRIAQLEIRPIPRIRFQTFSEVGKLTPTDRGIRCCGSTGK